LMCKQNMCENKKKCDILMYEKYQILDKWFNNLRYTTIMSNNSTIFNSSLNIKPMLAIEMEEKLVK
jgi:hypothetical protein